MFVEQKCRVFDEDAIRWARKLGQSQDGEACPFERLLVGSMLPRGQVTIDRQTVEMSQCATAQVGADRSRKG